MRTLCRLSLAILLVTPAVAQPTDAELLSGIQFRNIGPSVMSGRIACIDVDPKNPSTLYVASASGGIWKSTGNGVSWAPIFDDQPVASMGCVHVSRADSNVLWVGTGESCNRNSVGWGDGIYKSEDGGATWTNMGLRDSQQIAKIVSHPTDPNKVWVAALGPLWGAGEERGVFMTEDGGTTWTHVLKVNEDTGASDMVIDPNNPDVLYVGMYNRRRYPWTFRSGGPGGGVFKSTDGGRTWRKLTNGLPPGDTGNIGLTIYDKNPRIVYAIVEAQRGSGHEGIYRTDDAGETWTLMGTHATRPFYYHHIDVDPNDDTRLFSLSTRLMESKDSGKTWQQTRIAMHVDFHAIWINPNDSNHMWVGNDGGVAVTWDAGQSWRWMNNIPVAQFYGIGVDMARPYHVYGGLQDNGTWGGPSMSRNRTGIGNFEWYRVAGGDGFHAQADPTDNVTIYAESQGGNIQRINKLTGESRSIRPRAPQGETYRFNWSSPIVMSPHDPSTIWFGGNRLFKSEDRGDNWRVASPDLTTNDPVKLAPMEGLTPERTGAEMHCTIITISESPVRAGMVWVGTDDGLLQISENDGADWHDVSLSIRAAGVPANTWVSRVEASRHKLERCYATFDGHRWNDMKPYVLVTEDSGSTWTSIAANLPANGSVYVIKEDPLNEDLLYVGTEFGLFVSFDRGRTWNQWRSNFPTVAVHDLVVHPRERELVVGTHGRAIWIAPVEPLQQLSTTVRNDAFVLFEPVAAVRWAQHRSGGYGDGEGWFYGQNPPMGARLAYYLREDADDLTLEITSGEGENVATIQNPPRSKGLHVVYWPLSTQRGAVAPGAYTVRLSVGGEAKTQQLTVLPDPTTE